MTGKEKEFKYLGKICSIVFIVFFVMLLITVIGLRRNVIGEYTAIVVSKEEHGMIAVFVDDVDEVHLINAKQFPDDIQVHDTVRVENVQGKFFGIGFKPMYTFIERIGTP